jgi:transcriptional regulator with XRE-family HTH domain
MVKKVKGMEIKIARLRSGYRQYDLAARLGIPPSRLSEIETGRRKVSPEIVERILKILKVSE